MKKFLIFLGTIAVLLCSYLILTGFRKSGTAFIANYIVLTGGQDMVVTVQNASSVGFFRKLETHQTSDGTLCVDCYAAFGGINGSIAAEDTFVIPLNNETKTIALYRNKENYEPVLIKNEKGEWVKAE